MDFLDWISDGVDYVGDLFKDAGDGAFKALEGLFSTDMPPESLGGDTPVTEYPQAEGKLTEEVAMDALNKAGSVENFAKWIEGLAPDAKKEFEKILSNRALMAGVAGGANAMLGMRAQDRQLQAQSKMQEDRQQFQTDTSVRRGAAPTKIASVRPKGLTEGYYRG